MARWCGACRRWPCPTRTVPKTVAELEQSPAVRLFVERAAAAQPRFTLTERNSAAVAEICRRLDGIPLALELAAARVVALTPAQVVDRLDRSFRLLTGGSRVALPRQQTLQAALDWSYDLLDRWRAARLRAAGGVRRGLDAGSR